MNEKIFAVAPCAMLLALCFSAQAQQPKKVHRIGILLAGSPSANQHDLDAFRQGLRERGYVEGQNITIEYRFSEERDRRSDLALELVRLKVDVIAASADVMVRAAKDATKTIPIAMISSTDPVGTGFVASLARPGGNVTGLSTLSTELSGKRLELLKETLPKISRVAVLWGAGNRGGAAQLKETEVAARSLGLQVQTLEVRGTQSFETAFGAATKGRADAVSVLSATRLFDQRNTLVDAAAKSGLPAMYPHSEYVDAGGLMSYGVNRPDLFRRAATYVDKILKGAKPTDLPVEQPTKFELVINLKAAKQIGLTIPPNVLARADKVIR